MKVEHETLIFRDLQRDIRKTNYLTHGFFPYPARFIPQIPRYFIRTYMNDHGAILDPFCGAGATLVEAKLCGYDSYGIEINPLGQLLTRVKTTSLDQHELDTSRKKLFRNIDNFKDKPFIPEFPNCDFWFNKSAQEDLGTIKVCIDDIDDVKLKEFYLVCLASIVRKCSNADPAMIKPVFTKRMRALVKSRNINIIQFFKEKVVDYSNTMIAFASNIEHMSRKSAKASVIGKDVRKIDLQDESIHLIITSPPFVNAQDYFRTTKFEIWWTGLTDYKTLLGLERELIGGQRVSNHDYNELHLLDEAGLKQIDNIIEQIYKKDKWRAYITYQYFVDMKKSFLEFKRVLNKSGKFCITIGDNVIRKIPINTHELIITLAEKVGFETERVGCDTIKAHALTTKRHKTAGLIDREWAMVFKKE